MASIPALVEPAVLRWARESIGLSAQAASRKINLPDDRVASWESGAQQPTIAQLHKLAAVYKRPLAAFFLAHPPAGFEVLRDFRRHQEAGYGDWSPGLHGEYRRALLQREQALELFELDDSVPPSAWKLSLAATDAKISQAARLNILSHSPLDLPANGGSPYDHLNAWVAGLEAVGVLVLATSGGRVETKEMRALSMYFDALPVIMVNGADAARGRLFSLLHEYAHLLLHTGGLCDVTTDKLATTPNRQLEARCNAIAADILMPAADVRRRVREIPNLSDSSRISYDILKVAAAPFGVSAEAFLRRLSTLGFVSDAFYEARRQQFLAAYAADEARSVGQGGNWYRNMARDLGKGYVRQVTDAHRRHIIDSYTAATYLNVKVGQLEQLAKSAAIREPV